MVFDAHGEDISEPMQQAVIISGLCKIFKAEVVKILLSKDMNLNSKTFKLLLNDLIKIAMANRLNYFTH